MTNTVFYRTSINGNLKRLVDSMTQKELRQEMKANGFRVVAVYSGNISYKEHDLKEFNL